MNDDVGYDGHLGDYYDYNGDGKTTRSFSITVVIIIVSKVPIIPNIIVQRLRAFISIPGLITVSVPINFPLIPGTIII